MRSPLWNTRFFSTTRGKIVRLLRGASRSVNELAAALEVTDNAVRAHLATLERDGLIQATGSRRGFRKPTITYSLTPEAEALFPKACGLLLQPVLGLMAERMTDPEMERLLREAGHRLAAGSVPALENRTLAERLESTLQLLGELGGMAEVEETDGVLSLKGHSCPFAAAVLAEPRVCLAAEALVGDLVGVPVRQRCERSEAAPRCRFDIVAPERRFPD